LDLETLAPYIPMDGEDFQLHPIVPDLEPLDVAPAAGSQHSFSNIASLFQPLSAHGESESRYPWTPEEKRGGPHGHPRGPVDPGLCSCMVDRTRIPPYQDQASTPLSSMGGRQNVQWPPDPLLTYQQHGPVSKAYPTECLAREERPSGQRSMSSLMPKQR